MRIYLITAIFLTLLVSCKNGDSDIGNESYQGGSKVIRIAEVSAPMSIFPHQLTNAVEALIASQIYEGLVRINPKDLSVTPGLAEKWEISENGKIITFHLRKGVKFQKTGPLKEKDVELTAKDVKFTFELLCTDRPDNLHFQTVCKDRILGANEFYNASSKGGQQELKGFKIIDDYTFSIELLNSPNIFLEILANPVAAILNKEAYDVEKNNARVGMGPFIYDDKSSNKTHIALYKNKDYYSKDKNGANLPYIDSLIIEIVASSEQALQGFQSGKFDFISSVPSSQLKQLVEDNIASFKGNPPRFIIDQRPEMLSSYYLFNVNKAPFNNKKLRQAINYGIDRDRIIERVLFGQAHGPAINGIVPPSFSFYNSASIKGYTLDIEKAKKLLKEAGYPDGKGLPELQLLVNSGNSRNNSVAVEIQKQLKNNLNINVTFESLPTAEKYYLQLQGKGDMYRDGWAADYPSPESFLSVFYGEHVTNDTNHTAYPNNIRYKNADFDSYYKKGRDAINRDSASVYFLKAEQILVDDAPLIPLWYDSNCRLISYRLKNFQTNALRYFDFTQVTIEDKK